MRTLPNERLSAAPSADGPERKCILSGRQAARDSLVRLAVSPDGDVLPDVLARAPGRGAWIGVSRADLEIAVARGNLRGALMRAFKGSPLSISEDLPDRIEQALVRALADRLGLEFRAGNLLLGTDRIAENARMGRVSWLAHAADAGEDGSKKLDQALRVGRDAEGTGIRGDTLPLDRTALSVALGRDNVVHLALTDTAAAERVTTLVGRLMDFQGRAETNRNEDSERTASDARPLDTTIPDPGRAQADLILKGVNEV